MSIVLAVAYQLPVYNCRSAASWPDDMAMSATYLRDQRFTYGIFYGCGGDVAMDIIDRLETCHLPTFHPLTLPTMFADIERNRHIKLVNYYLSILMRRVTDIDNGLRSPSMARQSQDEGEKPESGSSALGDASTISQWLDVSYLRKGLENWKLQLDNLLACLAEVEDVARFPPSQEASVAECIRRRGIQINARLRQIMHEYDDKIQACTIVTDGLNFATQTVRVGKQDLGGSADLAQEWNQIARKDTKTNLDIAKATMDISTAAQRDSCYMKKISLLTIAFLPGTFVAVRLPSPALEPSADYQDALLYVIF